VGLSVSRPIVESHGGELAIGGAKGAVASVRLRAQYRERRYEMKN
jgi:hypothetical protein